MVQRFKEKSGGKPAQGGAKVAYAPTKEEGWEHAHRLWPNAGLPGEMAQILPTPEHFEQATELVTEEMTRDSVVAGTTRPTTSSRPGRTPRRGTTSSTSPTWVRTTRR